MTYLSRSSTSTCSSCSLRTRRRRTLGTGYFFVFVLAINLFRDFLPLTVRMSTQLPLSGSKGEQAREVRKRKRGSRFPPEGSLSDSLESSSSGMVDLRGGLAGGGFSSTLAAAAASSLSRCCRRVVKGVRLASREDVVRRLLNGVRLAFELLVRDCEVVPEL